MLVEHTRVWGNLQGGNPSVESEDSAQSAGEALHHSELANIRAVLNHLGLLHQIAVHIDCIGVEPGDVAAIGNRGKHVVLVVPAERIHHVANLLDLGLVDKSQEHVAVAVNKAHLAL